MLDSFLNTVKKASERVQRRGEEVAQVARLRVEVFQLNRELDATYARLGRSYHGNAGLDILQGVREDIRRIEEEITSRERLITELGDPGVPPAEGQQDLIAPKATTPAGASPTTTPPTTTPLTSEDTEHRPPFQAEPGRPGSGTPGSVMAPDAESDARPDGTPS